jgi:23S rRNA maturation-related 3'-5' exoribonuclease YhaM
MLLFKNDSERVVEPAVEEMMQQLPVTTFIELRNYMYTTLILTYLKKVAKTRGKPLYTFKDEGNKICQALIRKDESDETLIARYEDGFGYMVRNDRLVKDHVIKKFTKAVARDSVLIDTIPFTHVRVILQQLNELNEAKETWKEDTFTPSIFPGIAECLYDNCLDTVKEYFEEPIASTFRG